jgi:hypothetical protein
MSTPMDIDPPAAAAPPAEHSHDHEIVKGKGKEEKPRFEVKKVQILIQDYHSVEILIV